MGKHSKKRSSIITKILLIPIIVILLICIITAAYVAVTMDDWASFDPKKVENMEQTSFIYDYKDDVITGIHGTQNRVNVSLKDVPKHVQNAFIAVEDVRFYQHHGIDIKRIFGALIQDIKARAPVQGGSTITQQLVKLSHLSNKKTLDRKLQEVFLAHQLEQRYSKDQILEMYLNIVYFGNRAYGIESAARIYFGKSVSELSIAEGALLAGIPKNPSKYPPNINKEASFARKDLIIDLMVKNGFIDAKEGEKAKKEELELVEKKPVSYPHGYFLDMALREAAQKLKVKEEDLFHKGYRIYTTLDTNLQSFVEELYKNEELFPKSPASGDICESALVILDAPTGEIRCIMGGREYPEDARKVFNRTIQSRRQPGSTIKPLISYVPAIENFDYTPVTFINDEPVNYNGYTPSNFDGKFRGPITLRYAIAKSINIPAVKVLKDIGTQNGISIAERFGIPFEKEDFNNLSIALGGLSKGITPMELARAYMVLADSGTYKDVTTIRRIEDSNGVPLYEYHPMKQQVISQETAFIMNDILHSTTEWGTASRLNSVKIPIAAKTGTSQLPKTERFANIKGTKDAWIAAYTPQYVITVWMGFDQTNNIHYLPSNAVGGKYPTIIAKEIFDHISKDTKAIWFKKPPKVVEVNLDKKSLEEYKTVALATSLTPKEFIVTEYFTQKTAPKEDSSYWTAPEAPQNFNVTIDKKGFPLISFTQTQSFASYNIYRIEHQGDTSSPLLIHTIKGEEQQNITWVDQSTLPGKKYGYYIVPVHPEIISSNKALEGTSTNTIWIDVPVPKLQLSP